MSAILQYITSGIVLLVGYSWVLWSWAADKVRLANEKRKAAEFKEQAQEFADTPHTGDDFKRRMRERIKRKS